MAKIRSFGLHLWVGKYISMEDCLKNDVVDIYFVDFVHHDDFVDVEFDDVDEEDKDVEHSDTNPMFKLKPWPT